MHHLVQEDTGVKTGNSKRIITMEEKNEQILNTEEDRELPVNADDKMTLLLVSNIFRNSTFYNNVDYVSCFILCNLVVGGSTGTLVASQPF